MDAKSDFFSQRAHVEQEIALAESHEAEVGDVISRLKAQLEDVDLWREFFSLLKEPIWLLPLEQLGFFDEPPTLQKMEDGKSFHAAWPASQYLARIAPSAPQDVAKLLKDIKTDNPVVLRDILEVTDRIPTATAATLVPAVCEAIRAGALGWHFPSVTSLCVRLATEGEADSATTLAEVLFTPHFHTGANEPSNRDGHWYIEGLKKVVPLLTAKTPNRFLKDLCQWLEASVAAKESVTSESDYSWSWRPAIEEHEQNRNYDFAGQLVGFVRQALEQAIGDNLIALDTTIEMVGSYHYLVFKRLRLHLINRFADRAPDLARSIMLDHSIFGNYAYKHEYAMLMGQRFSILSKDQQQAWLRWIDEGPDMSSFDDSVRRNANKESTDEDRLARVEYWQFQRLHWVREHLDGERRKFYERMLAQGDSTELSDLNVYHNPTRWGWESPFSVEEFEHLTFAEVLDRVDQWSPEQKHAYPHGPDLEGLGRTFGEYAAGKAEEFSEEAKLLKGRQPIFVRTFLEKMSEAVRLEKDIRFPAVWELCSWVVGQPLTDESAEESGMLVDKNWQWARDAICELIREACGAWSKNVDRYPLDENREIIGGLLDQLVRDPVKSYYGDEEERKNIRLYDFVTAAINSPRGKAVNALLAYARWIANHIARGEDDRKTVPGGFDGMPEVKRMLEWQITAENGSFETSAMLGSEIGLLHWIDKPWLAANVPKIFDLAKIETEPASAYGWGAWNAFLVWGSPHREFYSVLRNQYEYAVKHLTEAMLPPDSNEAPIHHLAEHLVIYFGLGVLNKDNNEELFFQFLENASPELRCRTIAFVGYSLRDAGKVPKDVLKRFQGLWDMYWKRWGQQDAQMRPQGGLFESWFICKQFLVEWSLNCLEDMFVEIGRPAHTDQIAEYLAEIANEHIEPVTRILDWIVRSDKEGYQDYAWKKPARVILARAMKGSEGSQQAARRLIDYLGRRGYVEFGNLLRESDAS